MPSSLTSLELISNRFESQGMAATCVHPSACYLETLACTRPCFNGGSLPPIPATACPLDWLYKKDDPLEVLELINNTFVASKDGSVKTLL